MSKKHRGSGKVRKGFGGIRFGLNLLVYTPSVSREKLDLVAKAANGRLLWTRDVASGNKEVYYTSSPTIGPDGVVYVGSWDGGLYAFRADGPGANTTWPQYRHDPQHTGRVTKQDARIQGFEGSSAGH